MAERDLLAITIRIMNIAYAANRRFLIELGMYFSSIAIRRL